MTLDCPNISIKKNNKNKNVGELQKYLKYLGYYDGLIDEKCGSKTVEAIKALQKQLKVKVDGEFGPKTCLASGINGVDISDSNLTLDIGTWRNIVNRCDAYLTKNKRTPNICYVDKENPYQYITYKKYQEILQRYIDFKLKNNKEPNFVYINKVEVSEKVSSGKSVTDTSSKSTKKVTKYISSPHWVTNGCNKLGQCTGYFCGPHSVRQCLCKFNIDKFVEKTLAGYAGTTTGGTGHPGLNTAIKYVAKQQNISLNITWKEFKSLGNTIDERFEALGKLMSDPNKAVFTHILYRNKFGHYEVIKSIDMKSRTIEVLNSLGLKKKDGSYNGYIETRSFNTEASYIANTHGNQPSICIIEKK